MLPLRIGLALGALSLAGLAALHGSQLVFALWLPIMGAGMAFALAAIGALVIDHSRPEETGVTSGDEHDHAHLRRGDRRADRGRDRLRPPGTHGYTIAFAMGALGLLAALVPTLLLERARDWSPSRRPRSRQQRLDVVARRASTGTSTRPGSRRSRPCRPPR